MTSRLSTVKLKPTVWDGLVVAVVIALASIVAIVFYGSKQGGDLKAVVSVGNQVVDTLPLSGESKTYTYQNNGYTLHVSVTDNGIRVQESDCPSQDCVHTGTISRAGQSIVCLPAQIVIHLEGTSSDAPDVIVG